MRGWLVSQLPSVMAEDKLISAFATAAEEIGSTFRQHGDALEYQLDPDLAGSAMLVYLAGWLGFPLDRHDDPSLHRRVLRALAKGFPYRGTAAAFSELATALTGGPVTVQDSGGIAGPGDIVSPSPPVVRLEVEQAGPLGRDRLVTLLQRELPIGVQLDLVSRDASERSAGAP